MPAKPAKRKKGRPAPSPPSARDVAPLTKAQEHRYTLMRRASITQRFIADALARRGVQLTRQTVNGTIRNRSVNEDVIAMFCDLTQSTRKQAWPDVPPRTGD